MKAKMTLHEVYIKLKELRERRNTYARILAEYVVANDTDGVKAFEIKFKNINEVIDYYSQIEVEFENKYLTKD